jgi:hypothetical protein
MAEGAAFVILDMLANLFQSTLGTAIDMLGLSGRLISALSFVSSDGGITGIGVALVIIAVVGYLLAKFFLGSVKTLMKLAFVAMILLALILLGYSFL